MLSDESTIWHHQKSLPETMFFENLQTFRQPRSHDAIKITHFFMQILKLDQVSFKLITQCPSVDGISRNQVLFSEKTEQLYNFWNP